MLSLFGTTQQELLKEIFKSKSGLTVDELTQRLGVTRSAVNQHLTSLEEDGFVAKGDLQETGGRPGRSFKLTQRGLDLFPKQYSWFSNVLLTAIKESKGSEGLKAFMKETAGVIASSLEARVAGKDREARLRELMKILNELSYDAKVLGTSTKTATVEARNCVYHALAEQHPEVCEFDIEILSRVTDSKVFHQECIVRGGGVCRFHVTSK